MTQSVLLGWQRLFEADYRKITPDLNLLENLSHEFKVYVQQEVRPYSKEELVEGIHQVWDFHPNSVIKSCSYSCVCTL